MLFNSPSISFDFFLVYRVHKIYRTSPEIIKNKNEEKEEEDEEDGKEIGEEEDVDEEEDEEKSWVTESMINKYKRDVEEYCGYDSLMDAEIKKIEKKNSLSRVLFQSPQTKTKKTEKLKNSSSSSSSNLNLNLKLNSNKENSKKDNLKSNSELTTQTTNFQNTVFANNGNYEICFHIKEAWNIFEVERLIFIIMFFFMIFIVLFFVFIYFNCFHFFGGGSSLLSLFPVFYPFQSLDSALFSYFHPPLFSYSTQDIHYTREKSLSYHHTVLSNFDH